MGYSDLICSGANATDIQRHLSKGKQVAFTIRIPENLKVAAVETAEYSGMSFSAFVRNCMIKELVREIAK